MNKMSVKEKQVRKYMVKYVTGKEVEPVSTTYCVRKGRYHLHDGHHRVSGKYRLGKRSILAKVVPCYLYGCNERDKDIELYNVRHLIFQ